MTLEVDSTSWREPQETDQITTILITAAACTPGADIVLVVRCQRLVGSGMGRKEVIAGTMRVVGRGLKHKHDKEITGYER